MMPSFAFRLVLLLLLPLQACTIGSSRLTLSIGDSALIADGSTTATITVCNESDEPADDITVTLRSSIGSWARATATDPRVVEAKLSSKAKCAPEIWVPPTKTGGVRFEALVADSIEAREDANIEPATVENIAITAAPPVLDDADDSSILVGVDIATKSGGDPTDGTVVEMTLVESDPIGAAALDDGPIVVGKKDSLSLIAAKGTKSVRLLAVLKNPASKKIQSCRVLAPLSTLPTLRCPP